MLALSVFLIGSVVLFVQPARCDELVTDYEGYNNAKYDIFPRLNFKSVDLDAPMLQVSVWNKDATATSGSHIFIRHDGKHNGVDLDSSPLILDAEDLSVVYLNRTFNAVFDVRVQQDGDKNYLTFYGGPMTEIGLGNGYAHAYDEHYNEVYNIAPQNLTVKGDLHECQFTGNGTALVTAYEKKSWDLAQYRGSRYGMILDSVFQEVELETNRVMFEWRASEHIPMGQSFENMNAQRWDYFHLNSIQKTAAGNYLLSARHTHAIYLINGTTGDVIWQLGGKDNQFKELSPFGDNSTREASNSVLSMAWQHHARFYMGREDEITLFDNHVLDFNGYNCKKDCSRAIHFKLDAENMTVRLLNEYAHPQSLQSQSQGSVQVLDNENVFVGWGRNPSFTEHTKDGEVVLSVQFSPWRSAFTGGEGLDNYRAYRMDWNATPYWPPNIFVERGGGNGSDVAYVSWNGATEVKHWVLFSSDSPDDLDGAAKVIARIPRSGFETTIPAGSAHNRYMRAAALDVNHAILGATKIFDMDTSSVIESNTTITDIGIVFTGGIWQGLEIGIVLGIGGSALVTALFAYLMRLTCVRSRWEARGEYMRIPWRPRPFWMKRGKYDEDDRDDEETAGLKSIIADDSDEEDDFDADRDTEKGTGKG